MVILNSIIDRVDFNFPYVAAFFQSSPSILCIPSGPYFLLLLMASGFKDRLVSSLLFILTPDYRTPLVKLGQE